MELDSYRKLFLVNYKDFLETHKIEVSKINENLKYEKLDDVIRVDVADGEFFFFKHDILQIIYISNSDLTQSIWNEFRKSFTGAPEKTVRSRAGKTSNQLIFADQGITVSLRNDEVDFIELYPSCSLQDYLNVIYKEPGKFIR